VCGKVWQHTTRLSLQQHPGRPPGCATFAFAYRACSCADGQAASTQARLHCAVRRAQGGAGLHAGCQLRRCKRRHKGIIAKKLATEIAGARTLERARRGGCCREERKAVCTRHGEPAQARPRPHARLGFRAGRGKGDCIVAPPVGGEKALSMEAALNQRVCGCTYASLLLIIHICDERSHLSVTLLFAATKE
jgi:hypothetical protein